MPFSFGVAPGARRLTMEPSFEKLLVLLADAGVQFVVVGSVAVTLHGYTRLTEVVDILIARTPENIARLLTALAAYGEGFARELHLGDFTDEEGAIRIVEETEQSQVDVFTRMRGLTFEDLITDAAQFNLSIAPSIMHRRRCSSGSRALPIGKRMRSTWLRCVTPHEPACLRLTAPRA